MTMTDLVHDLRMAARSQRTFTVDQTLDIMMEAANAIESLRNELASLDAQDQARDRVREVGRKSKDVVWLLCESGTVYRATEQDLIALEVYVCARGSDEQDGPCRCGRFKLAEKKRPGVNRCCNCGGYQDDDTEEETVWSCPYCKSSGDTAPEQRRCPCCDRELLPWEA